MKLFLLALLASGAMASCPNQCSGHGRCGEYDKCICYKQYGLDRPSRFAWAGPDCSQRTCPLGKTFDFVDTSGPGISPIVFKPAAAAAAQHLRITFSPQNRTATFKNLMRDVTFQVKVMSVSADASVGTFAWKFDEDEFYEPESLIGDASSESKSRGLNKVNLATGVAVAEAHTGVHVWWDPYYAGSAGFTGELLAGDVYTFTLSSHGNLDFAEGDSNTAHQEAECSGRGTCNTDTGKCDCLPGFTGEACQRTTCPASCSGHGVCQSEARFVAAAGIKNAANVLYKYASAYDADKSYGCKCDTGYHGPACDQVECPSGADPMGGDGGAEGMDCSGRGLCDFKSGVCNCFKGFYGERCETQSNFV